MINLVLLSARVCLAMIFVVTGVSKIKAGNRWFLHQVLDYHLLRGKLAILLSRVLPWLEIFLGLCILLGFGSALISMQTFILLLTFNVAVLSTIWRNMSVGCGCFGRRISRKTRLIQWTVLYRNLVLMAMLYALYYVGPGYFTMDNWLKIRNNHYVSKEWFILAWGLCLAATMITGLWKRKSFPSLITTNPLLAFSKTKALPKGE